MAVEPLAHFDTGGELPAVVLIHGMTFSKATWDPIVDRLRDRFRCLCVDLPGHGESSGSGADPMVVVERIHATVVENGASEMPRNDEPLTLGQYRRYDLVADGHRVRARPFGPRLEGRLSFLAIPGQAFVHPRPMNPVARRCFGDREVLLEDGSDDKTGLGHA